MEFPRSLVCASRTFQANRLSSKVGKMYWDTYHHVTKQDDTWLHPLLPGHAVPKSLRRSGNHVRRTHLDIKNRQTVSGSSCLEARRVESPTLPFHRYFITVPGTSYTTLYWLDKKELRGRERVGEEFCQSHLTRVSNQQQLYSKVVGSRGCQIKFGMSLRVYFCLSSSFRVAVWSGWTCVIMYWGVGVWWIREAIINTKHAHFMVLPYVL